MVKKINERAEYDIKSDDIKNKSQRFSELILPEYYEGGMTLNWFADMVDMLQEKYGRYWKEMKIVDIKFNSDETIRVTIDCSR